MKCQIMCHLVLYTNYNYHKSCFEVCLVYYVQPRGDVKTINNQYVNTLIIGIKRVLSTRCKKIEVVHRSGICFVVYTCHNICKCFVRYNKHVLIFCDHNK